MQSRRDILKAFGTTLAASATLGVSAQAQSLHAFVSGTASEAPWALLAPLSKGASVGKGWTLSALSPVRAGASVLTLKHARHGTARVHICAHQGKGQGLSQTRLLDFVLMDGGNGAIRTNEDLARVVKGISKRVAKNEVCAVDKVTLDAMSGMLTHDERMALFGPENIL